MEVLVSKAAEEKHLNKEVTVGVDVPRKDGLPLEDKEIDENGIQQPSCSKTASLTSE